MLSCFEREWSLSLAVVSEPKKDIIFVEVKKSEGFYWKQSELRKSVCFQLVFGKKWQVMCEWSLWCTNGCNKVVFKCLLKMT